MDSLLYILIIPLLNSQSKVVSKTLTHRISCRNSKYLSYKCKASCWESTVTCNMVIRQQIWPCDLTIQEISQIRNRWFLSLSYSRVYFMASNHGGWHRLRVCSTCLLQSSERCQCKDARSLRKAAFWIEKCNLWVHHLCNILKWDKGSHLRDIDPLIERRLHGISF